MSYDIDIQTMKPVKNGTARYSNMYNNSMEYGTSFDLYGDDKVECFPYVRLSIGVDFFKDLDDDPLHSSLPSGEYDGVTYTHSDNCLCAKYPRIAARLKPIARFFIKQQYSVSNPTREKLVVDAIGVMLAASAKAYGIALSEARVRSGYHKLDENNNFFGQWILADLNSDMGHYDNVPAANAVFKADFAVPLDVQESAIAGFKSQHYESVSKFDDEINAYLENVYLSKKVKALVKLLCGSIIKGRFADADTNRFYVFSIDEQLNENKMAFNDAAAMVQNYANNHLAVILHRYTFMPDLLANLGVFQIDTEKDKVRIEKDANKLSIIVDDQDSIKNTLDHMGVTLDSSHSASDATERFLNDAIFVESDSYLKGDLELGDHVDVANAIMTVLLKDGLRLYNLKAFEVSKAGSAANPTLIESRMSPVAILATPALLGDLSQDQVGQINALNCIHNTTKLIDPTVTLEYGIGTLNINKNKFIFRTAINTYISPRDESRYIAQDCLLYIAFDGKKVKDANEKLANSNESDNDVA